MKKLLYKNIEGYDDKQQEISMAFKSINTHSKNVKNNKVLLTIAWTQCTVPALTHTRSPGFWTNRYTGTRSSYKSSRIGHHDPIYDQNK